MSDTAHAMLDARVLVVDDDAPARQVVRKYLTGRGSTVFEAENAYFALGRMTQAEIDLVITDINMPGRSGLWLMEEIRTRWPNVQIIVATGDESSSHACQAIAPGVTVLSKPYSLHDLGAALDKILSVNESSDTKVEESGPASRLSGPYVSPSLQGVVPGPDADSEQTIPWFKRIHPDDMDRVLATVAAAVDTMEAFNCEYRLFSQRGDIHWVQHEARVANFPNRRRVLVHEAVVDITTQRREVNDLRASEERHRFLTEYSSDMISIASWEGTFLYVSRASATLLGYEPDELIGTTLYDLVSEEDRSSVRRTHMFILEKPAAALLAYRVRRKDGRAIWFESTIREVPRSGRETPRELVLVSRDITERKLQEDRLRDMAVLDDLTGLYNRRGFMALATQHLKQAKRANRQALLVFADLNGLKTINDTHGHADGDRALIAAADALNRTFRDSDVVARIGGDEFAILAVEADNESIENIKARLKSALDSANRVNPRPYDVSVSIGVVPYDPGQAATVEELMAGADRAMYMHKVSSRDLVN